MHKTEKPWELGPEWAFLDWRMFLIKEKCYRGKSGGLWTGQLPSGSLGDQGCAYHKDLSSSEQLSLC